MTTAAAPSALIVFDVQEGFHDAEFWGPSTNPAAESNVEALVSAWRRDSRGPVVLVRHDSVDPASPLRTAGPGNAVQAFLDEAAADLLVTKSVNSAFYGDPALDAWLGERGIHVLVLCGIQTNMCVETTARMAGNLGYSVTVVLDATRTFDLTTTLPDGEIVHRHGVGAGAHHRAQPGRRWICHDQLDRGRWSSRFAEQAISRSRSIAMARLIQASLKVARNCSGDPWRT